MSPEIKPTKTADWQLVLVGEQIVFGLLGKVLFEYPDREWYEFLAREAVFDDIPLGADQPDVQAGLALLRSWGEENQGGLAGEQFDALCEDYNRLFIGPGKVLAPPWESVHLQTERVIFQVATLKVREWYQRYGLESVKKYKEPDDHVGLELAFTAHLATLGLSALERNDRTEFESLVEAQKQFLSEHTLVWAGGWSGLVEEHAHTAFFKGIALVTRGVLAEIMDLLEISGAPPDD